MELILKFADKKKINLKFDKHKIERRQRVPSAFYQAKDSPDIAKLLLEHCKYDHENLCDLGTDTLARLLMEQINSDEPLKKKIKVDSAPRRSSRIRGQKSQE